VIVKQTARPGNRLVFKYPITIKSNNLDAMSALETTILEAESVEFNKAAELQAILEMPVPEHKRKSSQLVQVQRRMPSQN
jgi:hypothetical protein